MVATHDEIAYLRPYRCWCETQFAQPGLLWWTNRFSYSGVHAVGRNSPGRYRNARLIPGHTWVSRRAEASDLRLQVPSLFVAKARSNAPGRPHGGRIGPGGDVLGRAACSSAMLDPRVACPDISTAVPTGHRAGLPARLHFAQCGAERSRQKKDRTRSSRQTIQPNMVAKHGR